MLAKFAAQSLRYSYEPSNYDLLALASVHLNWGHLFLLPHDLESAVDFVDVLPNPSLP